MVTLSSSLVLASASPRRSEILAALGLPFRVVVSEVLEERASHEKAIEYTERLAAAKATKVADSISAHEPDAFVLGADTVVVCDNAVLEKPSDDADGVAMIMRLSGRTHQVATAFALVHASRGLLTRSHVVTEVAFRVITQAEAERYVASGEGRDKAGGYAVQGRAGGFVVEIRGSYPNIVGLPAREVLDALLLHGAVLSWP
ncbi:MAG: septum formation inhibitor Maf [Sandaracinaceae bacterium]|nr:septum formation inhibitor Maf [Sandaracinaceae bacterium]